MTSGELIGQTEWPPSCRTMPTDCASRISAMSVPEIFSPFGSELSASTACRLHIAAFAVQLDRIFVERASAPSIASVASAASTRHRLLRDSRRLRRCARVAASLKSTLTHTSSK